MDRRSGLKKAHFSSVPTRMSLFTCKKYVFLIEKNFPNPTPHSKIGKTQHNAFLKLNASLPKGRVGKLNTTLFMNRVVGWVMARSTIRVLCLFSQAMGI